MPNRILRDYSDSRSFKGITKDAEILFIRLLIKVDDFGRFHADPELIERLCFPFPGGLNSIEVSNSLSELRDRGIIMIYQSDGIDYLVIRKFRQRTRSQKSKFPQPEGESPDWMPPDPGFQKVVVKSSKSSESSKSLAQGDGEEKRETGGGGEEESFGSVVEGVTRKLSVSLFVDDDLYKSLVEKFPGIDVEEELRKLYRLNGSKPSRAQAEAWLKKARPKLEKSEEQKPKSCKDWVELYGGEFIDLSSD